MQPPVPKFRGSRCKNADDGESVQPPVELSGSALRRSQDGLEDGAKVRRGVRSPGGIGGQGILEELCNRWWTIGTNVPDVWNGRALKALQQAVTRQVRQRMAAGEHLVEHKTESPQIEGWPRRLP